MTKNKIALTVATLVLLAACGGSGDGSALSSGIGNYELTPGSPHRYDRPTSSASPTPTIPPISPSPSPTSSMTPLPTTTNTPGPSPSPSASPNPAEFSSGHSVNPSLLDFVRDEQNGLPPKITLTADTNTLDLARATRELTSTPGGDAGKDLGVNAVRNGIAGVDRRFGKALIYRLDDNNNNEIKSLIIRDPETAGWRYQTFGQVADRTRPVGYVSIGKPTAPSDIVNFRGEYEGIAMGTYDTNSEVVSNVRASVVNRRMTLNMTDSKIAENIRTAGFHGATADRRFDVSNQQLEWDSTGKKFVSPAGYEAKFYGGGQEEMGGTFNRDIDNKTYRGGFGAKRIR